MEKVSFESGVEEKSDTCNVVMRMMNWCEQDEMTVTGTHH